MMKKFLLSGLCCAGLLALLPETGRAHGGQYRGPGDVVPPGGGGGGGGGSSGGPSGPTTGGPAGPSAPAPSGPATGGGAGPTTGGPSGPAGGGSGPTTGGRGVQLTEDLTEWKFWWEFNKDPYIRLRDAVLQGGPQTGSDDFFLGSTRRSEARDSLRPTEEQILGEILPALKKAIDSTEQRDINSSCMVAMAKIGTNHPDFKLLDVFKPRLRKNDLEISETAALSIGIAAIAEEDAVDLLTGLALDNTKGREACGSTGTAVNYRVRSFALYGLGLLAHKHSKTEIKAQAFQVMKEVLEKDQASVRDLKVAAINGMSILNLGSSTEQEKALLDEVLQCLEGYYMKSLGAGEQLIQAHCPTAIAKLIGRDHEKSDRYKQLFADDLQEKGKVKRVNNDIFRSCAMALGMMARPHDDKDDKKNPDNKFSKLLLDTYHDHKDLQTRSFALLALGQIGGDLNREILLKEFDKGGKNQEKTWCSLALGVYCFHKYEQQREVVRETTIGATLTDALKQNKDPSLIGALAIGLGLCRATEAADTMRSLMLSNVAKEEMAGYLCIGLALMNDVRSIEDMRNVVQQWTRRDQLLQQAAIALGKLGDKKVAEMLLNLMSAEGENNLAKLAAIASALGFIGDQRSIRPLKDMLFNSKLSELARAFAAVALGGVADKEMLPWNSKIGVNLNYRASVETLTNSATGILDIL